MSKTCNQLLGILSLLLYHIALSALIFEALGHQDVVFETAGKTPGERENHSKLKRNNHFFYYFIKALQ